MTLTTICTVAEVKHRRDLVTDGLTLPIPLTFVGVHGVVPVFLSKYGHKEILCFTVGSP